MPLLNVRNVAVDFPVLVRDGPTRRATLRAVDDVSFGIDENEIVAVVGESGCGKTTLARAVAGLSSPTSGSLFFAGEDVTAADGPSRRRTRRDIQMVFQDPFESLNPRKTVFQTLAQPLKIQKVVPASDLRREAAWLLEQVGLSPAAGYLDRYPHEFSGGQRQRICIARAIAVRPRLVVADEAVSALDISIRAQILQLFRKLKDEFSLSYMFITHDLGVVRSLCERVIVMYLGQIVEIGATEDVFRRPRHPYTAALLASSPLPDPTMRHTERTLLQGDVPSPISPPPGCRFHTRCPMVQDICRKTEPAMRKVGATGVSKCHFADQDVAWNKAVEQA
ncbi:sulfate transport system ATP-binding protein [Rhizobiaceae bacterium]|nr:sulfate transport system ATP-binding protein [Rhizobiaceae bacterium]